MTERRQRRLDGLAPPQRSTSIRPPSAAPSEQAEPNPSREPANPSPTTRARAKKPTATPVSVSLSVSASSKHRRAVSVPAPLAQQLRDRAQQLDRYHTDLVLECLAAIAPAVHHDGATDASDDSLVRPRRRAHRGRTVATLTLYLSQGEVEAIDGLARTAGHTRSGLVAKALEHHLAGIS